MTPSEVFRQRIKEARTALGWSQERLADAAGMYPTLVAKIETGQRKEVTLDEAITLAAALDVSPLSLFVPLEDGEMEFGPHTADAATVRGWVRGRWPLRPHTADAIRFYMDQSDGDVPVRLREDVAQSVRDELQADLFRRLEALGIKTESVPRPDWAGDYTEGEK